MRSQRHARARVRLRSYKAEAWAKLPHNPKKTFIVTLETWVGNPDGTTRKIISDIEIVSTTPKQVRARLWSPVKAHKILNIREK